jgi:curved DNA-binding protein CbpA
MSTLYHVLGLDQDASQEQVKAAFRKLAVRFHPDVNAGNDTAEQRFKEVNQAYETLADPDTRAAYDRALVCRAEEVRQRRWNFTATAAASFALTSCFIGFALWSMRTGPDRVRAVDAADRAQVGGTRESAQAADEKAAMATLATTALPAIRARGSAWVAYRNAEFKFSLKYPADVFAYDIGSSTENVRTFVSRDGVAVLNIFTANNLSGTLLARYRRARVEEHYADAVFEKTPQRKYWFVLSGTQGERAFYERVTLSCDGRTIHGWQMIFPISQRTVYDLVADEVNRTYTQMTRPGARCE